jgi:hypothetical protein
MALANSSEESWEHLRENPSDHRAWVRLVELVDAQGDAEQIRQALRGLLSNYPLSVTYWKKLTSHEKKYGGVAALLEESVAAAPHSCQMWLQFSTETLAAGDTQKTRAVFRRAVDAVGTDPGAASLWDAYIEFENNLAPNLPQMYVLEAYLRLMHAPVENLDAHNESLQNLAATRSTGELAGAHKVMGEGSEAKACEVDVNPTEEDVQRATVMDWIQSTYEATKVLKQKTARFVAGTSRREFDFTPLPDKELEVWHSYLTFATTSSAGVSLKFGTLAPNSRKKEEWTGPLAFDETVKLFQRALVPCAQQACVWEKFANFMQAHDADAACEVYRLALSTHSVRGEMTLVLLAAGLEERMGRADHALQVYRKGATKYGACLEMIINHVNCERRAGGDVKAVYARAFDTCTAAGTADGLSALCYISMHYSRYLASIPEMRTTTPPQYVSESRKQFELALGALEEADAATSATLGKTVAVMWLSFIRLESSLPGDVDELVSALFERALGSAALLAENATESMWEQYVAFKEDRGSSLEALLQLQKRRNLQSKKQAGKRKQSNGTANVEPASKVQKLSVDGTQQQQQHPQQHPQFQQHHQPQHHYQQPPQQQQQYPSYDATAGQGYDAAWQQQQYAMYQQQQQQYAMQQQQQQQQQYGYQAQ